MSDPRITWALFVPLIGGAVAAVLLVLRPTTTTQRRAAWLDLLALLSVSAALLVEGILIAAADGTDTASALGLTLTMTAPARLVLLAANAALFCAAVMSMGRTVRGSGVASDPHPGWTLVGVSLTSALVAGAALADDPLLAGLFLLAAGFVAAGTAVAPPAAALPEGDGDEAFEARVVLAQRIAAALKQAGLTLLGSGLLIAGTFFLARYTLSLENRTLLQLGLGLLAVGMVVRAGAVPFAAPFADLLAGNRGAAAMALGAGIPAALVVGLRMFAPVEGSLAGGAAAAWIGAVSALLAGLRALGAAGEWKRDRAAGRDRTSGARANLAAMSVALAVSWALFGILSGSQLGATGAVLIAVNIALSVPIFTAGGRITALGAASLLGLPPLGGFTGMLLVAQSAANAGGLWLALLLFGSALVASGWLSVLPGMRGTSEPGAPDRPRTGSVDYLAVAALLVVQIALFLAAGPLVDLVTGWATVPWLTAP